MEDATREEAKKLRTFVTKADEEAAEMLSSYSAYARLVAAEISTEIPRWTAEELLPVISPLYPSTRKPGSHLKLVTHLSRYIRRFPNPDFESRFSKDAHTATEFFFDRTDALLFMAKKWGGCECRLQSNLASYALGWLRDPRFIFPALESEDFNERLTAVSCLAFLWSDEGNEVLRRIATDDQDYGVRQSALWAYGFATGSEGISFIKSRAHEDSDARVREFAENMLQAMTNDGLLWVM
jgi:hypothetical protein